MSRRRRGGRSWKKNRLIDYRFARGRFERRQKLVFPPPSTSTSGKMLLHRGMEKGILLRSLRVVIESELVYRARSMLVARFKNFYFIRIYLYIHFYQFVKLY